MPQELTLDLGQRLQRAHHDVVADALDVLRRQPRVLLLEGVPRRVVVLAAEQSGGRFMAIFVTKASPSPPGAGWKALTTGKPATSRIAFSGYIAVIWPPSSGSKSTTPTRSPRKPA